MFPLFLNNFMLCASPCIFQIHMQQFQEVTQRRPLQISNSVMLKNNQANAKSLHFIF